MQNIAQRESISQNELIEQALEHESVARGAMWAEALRAAADRLTALTDAPARVAARAEPGRVRRG